MLSTPSSPQLRKESLVGRLEFRSARLSQRGVARDQNEDYALCEECAGVFAVADGLGGYEGGAAASELLCAVVAGELMETRTGPGFGIDDAKAALEGAISTAIDGMKEIANGNPTMASMGSTIVVAWLVNGHIYYAHAGDSRLYLLRNKGIRRLTCDDSMVERLCQEGAVSESDRRTNTWRHYLTRYVGPRSKDTRIHVDQIQIEPGDRLILLTDGITESLEDEAIRRAANLARTPAELCRWLSIAANSSGARDDMSCVAIDFNTS